VSEHVSTSAVPCWSGNVYWQQTADTERDSECYESVLRLVKTTAPVPTSHDPA